MEDGFLGHSEHSIDHKGRLVIPAEFRGAFGEGLILTKGFDRCLIAYPLEQWGRMAELRTALSTTRADARRLNRLTFAHAFRLELDRQGRIVLPPPLKKYAGIKNGVVIAGTHDYVEIWAKEVWDEEEALMDEQASQIAERVEL